MSVKMKVRCPYCKSVLSVQQSVNLSSQQQSPQALQLCKYCGKAFDAFDADVLEIGEHIDKPAGSHSKLINALLFVIAITMPLVIHIISARITDSLPYELIVAALGFGSVCLLLKRTVYSKIDHSINLALIILGYSTLASIAMYLQDLAPTYIISLAFCLIGFQCLVHAEERAKVRENTDLLYRQAMFTLHSSSSVLCISEIMHAQKQLLHDEGFLLTIDEFLNGICHACIVSGGALKKLSKQLDKRNPYQQYCNDIMYAHAALTIAANTHRSLIRQALEEVTGKKYTSSTDEHIIPARAIWSIKILNERLDILNKYDM